jgi:hypothetical protein
MSAPDRAKRRIDLFIVGIAALFALAIAATIWLEADYRHTCEARGGHVMYRGGLSGSFACISADGRVLETWGR